MRQLDPGRQRRCVDGEVVVLAGDLDGARGEVFDRVVGAVVPERQLDRLGAQGPAEQLVAEADAEDRHLAEQLADRLDGVGHLSRVARPVGQEDAVGLASQHVGRRRRGRDDVDRAEAGEVAKDRPLDAEVVGDDRERAIGADRVRRRRGDGGDEIDARRCPVRRSPRRARSPRSSAGPKAPGIAPVSRIRRVRRRVSMPLMPGMS